MYILQSIVLNSRIRQAMPIAIYPGIHLTGASVKDIVTSASSQFEAQTALHERYNTRIVLTGMDLSVEAEAFGCTVKMLENEIPTVIGRLIENTDSIDTIEIPTVGENRTGIYLDVAGRLKSLPEQPIVLGGVIGPFSLAGRLFGISELLELTIESPHHLHDLLEKVTHFLLEYTNAFKEAGAHGIIMAEPVAGLLSPRALSTYSSSYIKRIVDEICNDQFSIVLHNCGVRKNHIEAVFQTDVPIYHFGKPMDILSVLSQANHETIIAGNLDPSTLFSSCPPAEIYGKTSKLLRNTSTFNNFIISSGCDLPPDVGIDKLDSFYAAVRDYNSS